jgi:hypothetical protein
VFNTDFVLETLANKRHTLIRIIFAAIGEKAVSVLNGNYLLVVCFKGTGKSRVMNIQQTIPVVVQLRRGSVAAPLLGSRVRIPSSEWIYILCVVR